MAANYYSDQVFRDIMCLIEEANRISTATEVAGSIVAINSVEEVARVSMSAFRANPLLWTAYNRRSTDRKQALDRTLLHTASPVLG